MRFAEDRLLVFASYRADVLAEVPYSQIEDVEIGGPGLVKSGGGFTGGGFGLGGAIEGMAIAAVLNAMTTRTSITTIMRIQGTGCELFLLHSRLTPDRLRIELSRTLGVIRAARAGEAAARPIPEGRPLSPSPVEELAKLANMLEKGPANSRRIRPDESQDPRAARNLIRRSMEAVRSVRRNPYRQVSILPGVRWRRHSPVPSGRSVRKL
jgi:hypothetical protein